MSVARPEVEPKTPLGRRLREVRRQCGDPEREEFAARLGIAKSSLANYERGERVPDADVLALYRERLGVNINWLTTDTGRMFEDMSMEARASDRSASVWVEAMTAIGLVVVRVYADEGVKLPASRIPDEMRKLFDEVRARVSDPFDRDEWSALVPWVEARLRKELREARRAPGTGKREAS